MQKKTDLAISFLSFISADFMNFAILFGSLLHNIQIHVCTISTLQISTFKLWNSSAKHRNNHPKKVKIVKVDLAIFAHQSLHSWTKLLLRILQKCGRFSTFYPWMQLWYSNYFILLISDFRWRKYLYFQIPKKLVKLFICFAFIQK